MIINKITGKEYIHSLLERRHRDKRRGRRCLGAALFFLMLAAVAYPCVAVSPGIPSSARSYLLYRIFFLFSTSELRTLLVQESGTSTLLPVLLAVYWGFHLSLILSLVASFAGAVAARVAKSQYTGYEKGVLLVYELQQLIRDFAKKPSRRAKTKLRRRAKDSALYGLICPVRRHWFKHPEHQWFSSAEIDRKARSILVNLSKFEQAFLNTSKLNGDIGAFLPPLEILEIFFLSVANRTNSDKFRIMDIDQRFGESEFDILSSFAKTVRPIVIRSFSPDLLEEEESKVVSWARRIGRADVVKETAAISGTAAAIMLVGVLLFKINGVQAFLTWFTVTFGSFSISVGITSFRK